MATEIDTREAVRIDPDRLVTELESLYRVSRGYTDSEAHRTALIALVQHHDMERLTQVLGQICDLLDSPDGLIVTAYQGEV